MTVRGAYRDRDSGCHSSRPIVSAQRIGFGSSVRDRIGHDYCIRHVMCATIPVCAGHGIKMCNKWHLHRTVLTVAYAAQVAYAAHRAAPREGGTGVASSCIVRYRESANSICYRY